MKHELSLAGKRILLLEPEGKTRCPVIYLHAGSPDDAEDIWTRAGRTDFALAAIMGIDWNADLSPWPAEKVFRDGGDFAGKADDYLRELTTQIVPGVERGMACEPIARGIAGYSLAGLFALHALYKTDLFGMAASMSGSLWFDGWLDFIARHEPMVPKSAVYLSLGDREGKTRNARMAAVEGCTRQAEEIFKRQGAITFFEMNEGNHFADIPERISKGLRWLTAQARNGRRRQAG